jgi:hypothetical protein
MEAKRQETMNGPGGRGREDAMTSPLPARVAGCDQATEIVTVIVS